MKKSRAGLEGSQSTPPSSPIPSHTRAHAGPAPAPLLWLHVNPLICCEMPQVEPHCHHHHHHHCVKNQQGRRKEQGRWRWWWAVVIRHPVSETGRQRACLWCDASSISVWLKAENWPQITHSPHNTPWRQRRLQPGSPRSSAQTW